MKKAKSARAKLEKAGVDFSRPRIACLFHVWGKDAVSIAAEYCEKRGYQAVGNNPMASGHGVNLNEAGLDPEEWLHAFSFFSAVITDRMHACIASLLFKTPVVGMPVSRRKMDYKIREVMEDFGMSKFYYQPTGQGVDALHRLIDERIEHPLDAAAVDTEILARKKQLELFSEEIKSWLERNAGKGVKP